LHCVWVFYDFVKEFNPRKLKNFEAKMEFSDLSELLENDNNFHGVDLDNLDVDRIIDKRLPSPKSEDFNIKYLVKWKSLQYEERSWERESYLTNFRDKIEFYEKSKRTEDSLNSGELNVSKLTDYIKNVNFTKFTEQPSFIENGHLHDYQLEGFNWLIYSWHQKNNIILADEMGLGKTIEAIAFLKYLVHCLENRGPFIICAPLSTLDNWKRELAHWFPEGNVVLYSGTQKSRHIIRLTEFFFNLKKKVKKPNLTKGKYRLCKFNILLTSYEIMLMDNQILRKFAWEALIIDEGQRLKNSCSKLYKEIIHFQTQFRMLMTGTPLQNNLSELLSLMQFISPKKFNADMQQKLLQEFNSLQLDVKSKILTGKDEREKGNEKDDSFLQVQVGDDYEDERSNQEQELINKMHKELKPHMLRRLKKDVMLEIPKKKELILRVDLSKRQREIYKCIFTRNFNALKELDKMKRKNKISIKSVANILMLLRLCTNHPLLLTRDYKGRIGEVEEYREGSEEDVDGLENNNESADGKRKTSEEKRIEKELIQESGKVLLLDKMLLKLYPAANRVLIFSQFKMMLDILEEYCEYRQFRYLRLDGNTPPLFRQKLIDQFNAPNSPYFIFLLSTRAGGLGINLASADTVFIFDSDFNPHNDLQALSRAHRIGQKNRVMIYRLVARYTVEEQIIQIAKKKLMIEHLVVKSNKSESLNKSDLDSILRFGTEKLFNEEKKDGIELNYNEEMIEHILNRGDDDEEEGSEGKEKRLNKIDDYLSAFKVADFPHLGTEKGVVKAVDEVTDVEENYWTKLLGEEYEKTIIKEQEKLGKGKRKRKYV
jgi:chromodomain-helicase-DNA-binding protein 4